MSLILDALSRAEREKREEASPAPGILAQEAAPHQSVNSPGKKRVVAVVVCLALTALLALGLLLKTRPGPTAKPDPNAPVLERSQTVKQADIAVREEQTPSEHSQAAARTLISKETSTPKQDAAVAALYAQPNEIASAETGAANSPEDPPERPAENRIEAADSLNESEIDVAAVLREVRAQAANDALQAHPAPLLKELTKQFKDGVPTLMYSRHDYSSAGPSTVTINGTSLMSGQRTRGVEVRDILSDSVILRFQGQDFRLRALNSWVNL